MSGNPKGLLVTTGTNSSSIVRKIYLIIFEGGNGLHRIILDTDIGTNADDAVALSLVLKSPEIILEGITTVYGDVHQRGAIAQHILQLCDAKPTNIYSGIELPAFKKKKSNRPCSGENGSYRRIQT